MAHRGKDKMKSSRTGRGFVIVNHPKYASEPPTETRLIQESSAIGDYEDSLDKPGSSFLWVGNDHHLNREEIGELIARMNVWLKTGRLGVDAE